MSDAAASWVSVNLSGQLIAGSSTATCQIVTISGEGMVLLPAMKGSIGMALAVELNLHHWSAPVALPCVLVREGEYHGHYAWQVQFTQLSPADSRAVLELMGLDPGPPLEEEAHTEVIPADEAQSVTTKTRSYSDVFADLPDMEVDEVEAARLYDDDPIEHVKSDERDLMQEVDGQHLNKIFKEAVRDLDRDNKPKKKKGWFS